MKLHVGEFLSTKLPNPPNYICGVTYSIAKDYISQKLHLFIKTPAWINRIETLYPLPALFIEENTAKVQVQYELQVELYLLKIIYIKLW
jgi:hypothetical protein